jgi:hypothetical protein
VETLISRKFDMVMRKTVEYKQWIRNWLFITNKCTDIHFM